MKRVVYNALLGFLVLWSSLTMATDYYSLGEVQQLLFPDATGFEDRSLTFTDDQRDAIKKQAKTRQRRKTQQVWAALKNDQLLGWVFLDDVIGKHEFITYVAAITPDGTVKGLEIVSYRETHGGEVREDDWRSQFIGKGLTDALKLGKDIDNISGATLSCRNLTDGVRRLLVQWQLFLRGT